MATILVNPFYVSGGGGGSTLLTGLVSWWDLTADGNDDHASNNLSNRGSPSFGTVGGQSCVTTDSSNHLYVASPTGLDLSAFTVAAWVYETSPGTTKIIAGLQDGTIASSIRYVMRSAAGSIQAVVSNGSANQLQSGDTVPGSTWVPVVLAFDSSTGAVSIWMNGSETTASGWDAAAGSFGFGIGGDGDGGGTGNEFVGSIKSVGVWNYKWSSTEVTAYTNGGSPLAYADL